MSKAFHFILHSCFILFVYYSFMPTGILGSFMQVGKWTNLCHVIYSKNLTFNHEHYWEILSLFLTIALYLDLTFWLLTCSVILFVKSCSMLTCTFTSHWIYLLVGLFFLAILLAIGCSRFHILHEGLGAPSQKTSFLGGVAQILIFPRPSPRLADVGLFVRPKSQQSPSNKVSPLQAQLSSH